MKSMLLVPVLIPLLVFLFAPIKKINRIVFYGLSLLLPILSIGFIHFSNLNETLARQEFRYLDIFSFSVSHFSVLFVIVLHAAWFLTILYSMGYLRHHFQKVALSFQMHLAVCISICSASVFSENLFTTLVLYFGMILAVFRLLKVAESEGKFCVSGGYLKSALLPPLILVLPILVAFFPMLEPYQSYTVRSLGLGPVQESLLLAVLIIGLSMNCVFPFHEWLPKVSVVPAPITGLIHSVGAVQVAMIMIYKIGNEVFGLEVLRELNEHFFQTGWLTYLCGGTAVYTAYRALRTDELKARFSFSTVGQLSYMITAFLVGTKTSLLAGNLHMVTHAFAKLNLFFMSGVFTTAVASTRAPLVSGWISQNRWAAFVVALSGLSISGFPALAGYYSKDMMLLEELHSGHYAAAFFLLTGSVINLLYIWPVIKSGLKKVDVRQSAESIPTSMLFAIGLCAIMILVLSNYINNVIDLLM